MMRMRLPVWFQALALAALSLVATPATALAGPTEEAFLESYVGNWRGTGALVGSDGSNEEFTCRVTVTKGRAGKINYAGRCSVARLTLSVAGTIAYIDANRRYEAAMSSNATFAGTAIGRPQGERVVFDLREQEQDAEGRNMEVLAQVSLGGPAIGLGFSFISPDGRSDATVDFTRR